MWLSMHCVVGNNVYTARTKLETNNRDTTPEIFRNEVYTKLNISYSVSLEEAFSLPPCFMNFTGAQNAYTNKCGGSVSIFIRKDIKHVSLICLQKIHVEAVSVIL